MTINERIRQIHQTLELTQGKFGERISISISYLAGMELGDKPVNERIIRLICMEFGVSEHWLCTGEGAMYKDEEEARTAQANSLFKTLDSKHQALALALLNAVADSQSSNS